MASGTALRAVLRSAGYPLRPDKPAQFTGSKARATKPVSSFLNSAYLLDARVPNAVYAASQAIWGEYALDDAVLQTATWTAAGGMVFAGAATYSSQSGPQTYSYSASGGMQLAGASSVARNRAASVSGGLNLGGASSKLATAAKTSTGGMLYGGAASQQRTRAYTTAGGMTFGGSGALVTYHDSTRTVVADGGLLFSGLADVSFEASSPASVYTRRRRDGRTRGTISLMTGRG